MAKIFLPLLLVGSLSVHSAVALADSDPAYDFSWLDPDKKVYVLQNRRYEKALKPMVSLMGGMGFGNPYRGSFLIDPRVAMYFTETLGIEAFFNFAFNRNTNEYDALRAISQIVPQTREIRSQVGALLHWAPWYAKINVFNKILYFDWYFSAGAGVVNTALDTNRYDTAANRAAGAQYQMESKFALYFGTGHQFHLNEHWLVRLDLMSTSYAAQDNPEFSSYWRTNGQFALGVGFRL